MRPARPPRLRRDCVYAAKTTPHWRRFPTRELPVWPQPAALRSQSWRPLQSSKRSQNSPQISRNYGAGAPRLSGLERIARWAESAAPHPPSISQRESLILRAQQEGVGRACPGLEERGRPVDVDFTIEIRPGTSPAKPFTVYAAVSAQPIVDLLAPRGQINTRQLCWLNDCVPSVTRSLVEARYIFQQYTD
jgi:hypothetical protein